MEHWQAHQEDFFERHVVQCFGEEEGEDRGLGFQP